MVQTCSQAVITGGTAPYVYLWSSGGSTDVDSNLSAGTYTLFTIDANGCLGDDSVTLVDPAPLLVQL